MRNCVGIWFLQLFFAEAFAICSDARCTHTLAVATTSITSPELHRQHLAVVICPCAK